MPDAEFHHYKEGLHSLLLAKDNNSSERINRFLENINVGIDSFDRKKQLAAQIEGITQREMEIFVQQSIVQAPSIMIKTVGSAHKFEGSTDLECSEFTCPRAHMTKQVAQ